MPDEQQAIKELDELSSIIEEGGEREVSKELEEIEQIAAGKTEEEEKPEEVPKKEEEVKKEEKKEEKEEVKEEKKEEVEKKKERVEKKPKLEKPHEAIKTGSGFKYASASLVVLGAIIYGLAFYLRWNGWRLIANPPSAVVALVGTLLILAGGEIYYRGKKR